MSLLKLGGSLNINSILKLWNFLSKYNLGRWLFTRVIGWIAPYTGTIGAVITELRPGFVSVEMKDRFKVRNHLGSIHAIALMNLAEFSSGLATLTQAPSEVKGILTHLEIDYHKKARGKLKAVCTVGSETFKSVPGSSDLQAIAIVNIYNTANEIVSTAKAKWRFRLIT